MTREVKVFEERIFSFKPVSKLFDRLPVTWTIEIVLYLTWVLIFKMATSSYINISRLSQKKIQLIEQINLNYFSLHLTHPFKAKICMGILIGNSLLCVWKNQKTTRNLVWDSQNVEMSTRHTHKTIQIGGTQWPYEYFCGLIFTIAKRRPISGISMATKASLVRAIQSSALCEFVARITNVRQSAGVHHTGEPCCKDTNTKRNLWKYVTTF